MKRFQWLLALAAVCMLATACGGSSSSTSGNKTSTSSGTSTTSANTGKVGGKLVVDNESGVTWTCQFNPFNSSVLTTVAVRLHL